MAAHAVAEHLVALQLPQHIQQRIERLIGHYEQRCKGSWTSLDIPPEIGISTYDKKRHLAVVVGTSKNVGNHMV